LEAKGTSFAANVSSSRKGYQQDALFARNKEQLRGATAWRFRVKKMARRPSHGGRLSSPLFIMTSVALCACFSLGAAAQESRAKYEEQYQLERDPVAKAKIVAKLGHFEIDQARADLKADKDEQSLADLEHYRDQVESAVQALSATGVNAEQHPAGFKELQISLRETLRHSDELILQLPLDKRPWFQAVRSDLAKSQNLLIEALFPTLGEKRSKKGDPR
jgi:hypothetical protein